MPDYELILDKGSRTSRRYRITPVGFTIGRGPDNDIPLSDQLVSRHHARLWVENGVLHIEDLESKNGTLVNGQVAKQTELTQGDSVAIGSCVFYVLEAAGSTIERTIMNPEEVEHLHQAILEEASGQRLLVLYQAAQLMGTVFDLDDLLDRILGLIFEALPVRRGFILILPQDGGAPEIHATRSKEDEGQGPPLSHTLIQHVFDKRSAILTLDAQQDSRFDRTESIMGHEIRAAMCAPLSGRNSLAGAIYVDSGTQPRAFTTEDLGLLTAVTRVVGVAVENARLYQENVQQERLAAIGQATAGLGHCIKNILTGIRGGSEFIDMAIRKQNLNLLEKGWPILRKSVERIDALVMDMLSFSKAREPQRSDTDLNALIRDVAGALYENAEKLGVRIVFEPRNEAIVQIDGREIHRVLVNLITNAVDACESGDGLVKITSDYDEEGCRVAVCDNGSGISSDVLPKLFQAFFSTKGSAGTGLGLASSRKIAREHGGDIEVKSELGKGSTFMLFLPRGNASQMPIRNTEKPQ